MALVEYSLFRAKFIKPVQKTLWQPEVSAPEIFLSAIRARPSADLRKGQSWHIGNLRYYPPHGGYFAIGRTTKATLEKFDEKSGDFLEEEQATSPYTHCVFDAQLGIVGIAKKTSLARTTKGIAKRLEELLATTPIVLNGYISVEILPIPDPEGFVEALRSADRVLRFSATFQGPNPFDADEFFQKPLSVLISAANGVKGRAQLVGDDLNKETLVEISRSTAATGNEASATILRGAGQRYVTVNLRGNPIKRSYDEAGHDPAIALQDLTEVYTRVRHD